MYDSVLLFTAGSTILLKFPVSFVRGVDVLREDFKIVLSGSFNSLYRSGGETTTEAPFRDI